MIPNPAIMIIFLNSNPTYHAIISQTTQRISTVQRSGIRRKKLNNIALRITNAKTNSGLFKFFFFLNNHEERNITYHSLKNSAGWIEGRKGTLIHHLAPFNEIPIQGTNTINCKTNIMTEIIIMFLLF
jgi:hypothetical protein